MFTKLTFDILCHLHRTKLCVLTGKMSHSCCSSTVYARLECCELGFASHLIDLLLDDRIRSLYSVLDDLGLFHLHCVNVVLGVYVHKLVQRFDA